MIMMRTKIANDNNYDDCFIDDDKRSNVKQVFDLMVMTVKIKTVIVLLIRNYYIKMIMEIITTALITLAKNMILEIITIAIITLAKMIMKSKRVIYIFLHTDDDIVDISSSVQTILAVMRLIFVYKMIKPKISLAIRFYVL